MIVTKYFNSDKNWEDYSQGSFKVGTLEEYRSTEKDDLARMSDVDEGRYQRRFTGSGFYKRIKLPGATFTDCTFENVGEIYSDSFEFNEHVFCCSRGDYDAEHHKKMLGGVEKEGKILYLGNPDLDAYAVIDLKKFLRGLRFWCASSEEVTSRLAPFRNVVGKNVSYELPRNSSFPIELSTAAGRPMEYDEYIQSIRNKPPQFSVENEYRIIVSKDSPNFAQPGDAPLFPKSRRLKDAIIRMGKIKQH